MPIREDFQRARSNLEKAARHVEILDAAEVLLLEFGNERFAISALADKVGVSKSTIFLYFASKEELLLALYSRAYQAFFETLRRKLDPGMSGRAFCEAFIDSALANPTGLVLRAHLARTIERSVSLNSLITSKQEILVAGLKVAAELESVLGLESSHSVRLLLSLINLMAGAAQADVQPFIDMEGLPDDVVWLIQVADTRTAFMSGAEFVFIGATGRPFD